MHFKQFYNIRQSQPIFISNKQKQINVKEIIKHLGVPNINKSNNFLLCPLALTSYGLWAAEDLMLLCVLQSGVDLQDVAVKTCKLLQDEDEVAEKFIREAGNYFLHWTVRVGEWVKKANVNIKLLRIITTCQAADQQFVPISETQLSYN